MQFNNKNGKERIDSHTLVNEEEGIDMPIKKPITIPIIVVTTCLALSFGFLKKKPTTTTTLFIIIKSNQKI